MRKQVTSRLFENSSSSEEDAEQEMFDYSFDSDDDTHPCVYCNEPFRESRENESWIQCTEPSCLKSAHCLCVGVNSRTISFVCELCLQGASVCSWLVYVCVLRNYNYIHSSQLFMYFFTCAHLRGTFTWSYLCSP